MALSRLFRMSRLQRQFRLSSPWRATLVVPGLVATLAI
jgi:hypothetical protein